MQIIKVRFLKEDKPTGKEYTYYSLVAVTPGDAVQINSSAKGIVTEVDVPEEEIAAYRDKVKTIVGLVENKYGVIERTITLDDFIGKTFVKVENINDEELIFTLTDGTQYVFYHEQDCCESVTIEDICGNLSDLENSPITLAEEYCHERVDESGWGDGATYTFYKFATVKGYVTVRWYGCSNGYYSESVDFKIKEVSPRE
ncbi:MAG: hypothetical protein Q4F83_10955 [Eubacteriales bacterium]|nr:hypothetical protein [Eubacteriales bacterium]